MHKIARERSTHMFWKLTQRVLSGHPADASPFPVYMVYESVPSPTPSWRSALVQYASLGMDTHSPVSRRVTVSEIFLLGWKFPARGPKVGSEGVSNATAEVVRRAVRTNCDFLSVDIK